MKKVIIIVAILLLTVIIGVSGVYIYVYNNTEKWTTLVYPGVKVGELDISGKTVAEAKAMVTEKYGAAILKKNISIKTPLKTYTLDYTKINAKYNVDEVVKEAFDYGKNLNLYEKYKLIKNPVNKQLNLKFVYDTKALTELVATMKKEIDKTPENGSLSFTNGKFIVTPDKEGAKLIDDKLVKEISSKISGDIAAPDIVVNAEIQPVLASMTKEKLSKIDTKISSFSSSFATSAYGRSTNITLATKSINGTLLMPGQSFSFNDKVGKRTAAKGYQPAPVDIGTTVGTDYGGGICQVSTSLYNAVIRANIKSTERNHHSIPSTYIPLGMDATVDWGNLDYKFTNTLQYPVYIESTVKDKVLTFNVYSNSSLADKTYNLVSEVYESVNPGPTQYIEDNTLPVGNNIEEQFPLIGYKVRTYEDTIQNGKVIDHQLISDDHYKVVAAVIRKGTKVS